MPLPTWSCVCRWSSVKGEGDIFSFDLLDGSGGEIRVTAFNEVAHELFPLIEMGSIYTVSRANLKNKNTVRHYIASTAKASTCCSILTTQALLLFVQLLCWAGLQCNQPPIRDRAESRFRCRALRRHSQPEQHTSDANQRKAPCSILVSCQYASHSNCACAWAHSAQFHPIAGLSEVTPGTMVNILGVVEEVAPWQVRECLPFARCAVACNTQCFKPCNVLRCSPAAGHHQA